ncbi:hypothetical protein ZIOFF_038376 [Zingiber officinale]|uniref:Uncharacterized protein n=1 Tax=Zingiber officinale TaxID=94328 RepID=A0A8J5L2R0_ZINOF|nr:hypothetical protein ZIOFF_038376 [Zingiber officinale]
MQRGIIKGKAGWMINTSNFQHLHSFFWEEGNIIALQLQANYQELATTLVVISYLRKSKAWTCQDLLGLSHQAEKMPKSARPTTLQRRSARPVALQRRPVALQHRFARLVVCNADLPLCCSTTQTCHSVALQRRPVTLQHRFARLSLCNTDLSLCNTDMLLD